MPEKESGRVETKEERIERMYREKQDRFARQIALQSAISLVSVVENHEYRETVERVKETTLEFYHWLRFGQFREPVLFSEKKVGEIAEKVGKKVGETVAKAIKEHVNKISEKAQEN